MHHAPSSSLPPRRLATLSLLLLAVLGCPSQPEGDDLPPGAFTSGGDELGEVGSSEGSTSVVPDDTTTTTSEPPDTGSSEGPPPVLSHAADIRPIWDASCTDAACHDADAPQAGLDLASEGVLDRLCQDDHNFSGLRYIDCENHDPQRSYAFRKIEGSHLDGDISGASGLKMPPTEALSQADIDLIEAWIVGGTLP